MACLYRKYAILCMFCGHMVIGNKNVDCMIALHMATELNLEARSCQLDHLDPRKCNGWILKNPAFVSFYSIKWKN